MAQPLRSSRPNHLLRGLLIASALAHLVALLAFNGWWPSTVTHKIEVSLAARELPARAMPRPRVRPSPPPSAARAEPQTTTLAPPLALPEIAPAATPSAATASAVSAVPLDMATERFGLPTQLADAGLSAEDRTLYFDMVRRRIERHKQYPVEARRRQVQGRVVVHFTLSRRGDLRDVAVAQTSRNAELDHAALEAVRRAAPFPPPPRGLGGTVVPVEVAILFELS